MKKTMPSFPLSRKATDLLYRGLETDAEERTKESKRADARFLRYMIVGVVAIAAMSIGGQLWASGTPEAQSARMERQLDAYLLQDTDKDGLLNGAELEAGTNLANPDTDGDGITDARERAAGLNPLNKADAAHDSDGDGLSNGKEVRLGTDPFVKTAR